MKKCITRQVIIDLTQSIGVFFPEFLKERKNAQEALVKSLSICFPVKDSEDEKMYFILRKKDVRSVGSSMETVNKLLEKYPILIWVGNKPSTFKKEAKRYIPTKVYEDILKDFHQRSNDPLKVYYKDEGAKHGVYAILANAPARKPAEEPDYQCVARVDTDGLIRYAMCQEFEEDFDLIQRIGVNRVIAVAKEKKGMLDQNYFRGISGRLFSRGVESVQNMPREVRKAAFKGCWDVDFVNCHYVIAAHFTSDMAIGEYAHAPDLIRMMIAKDLEITIKEAKTALLMVLYGAGLSGRKGSSLSNLLGQDKAERFLAHNRVKCIIKGIEVLKQELLEDEWIFDDQDITMAQNLANFLQAREGNILDTCIDLVQPEALFFDGFICREEPDIEMLEQAVFEEHGIVIKMKKEVI